MTAHRMGAWPDQTLAAACSESKQSSAQRFAIAGTAFGSNESGIFEVGYGIPVRGGTLDFDGFYNKTRNLVDHEFLGNY